jgi:FMN-dependent oxidoreductase (nitrilotriacetate monooxygenase family)
VAERQVKLGLSMRGLGYHPSAWLDPAVPPNGALQLSHYIEMSKTAERGLFDLIFLADHAAVIVGDIPKGAFGRNHEGVAEFEPITLIAALSQHTSRVGLVSTASTTHHEPYQLARQFASIDHLSGGRAGWNVVTSSRDAEARNFSEDRIPPKSERYERAREALTVCFGLWESWEPDAFLHDRSSGLFFDRSKLHAINHKGKHFRVDGPLTMPPTPQGRPIIVQAGSSEEGMEFASLFADVIYTVHRTLDTAQSFYARMKKMAAAAGREPSDVLIFPGLLTVVAESRDAAIAKYERMNNLLAEITGLERMVRFFGDLSGHYLDGPLPDVRTDIPIVSRSSLELKAARENNWTIRQYMAEMSISHGHAVAVGTPSDIVDHMEQWMDENAADGFNILPALSPGDVTDFVSLVIPEMQKRGIYRTAYDGRTLRENLGLSSVTYGSGLKLHPAGKSYASLS